MEPPREQILINPAISRHDNASIQNASSLEIRFSRKKAGAFPTNLTWQSTQRVHANPRSMKVIKQNRLVPRLANTCWDWGA